MVEEALDDAGLTLADVDGVCHTGMSSMLFAEYLGIHPRFTDRTMTGGSSFEVHVEHAAAAIAAGLCDVVVDVYAATPRSDRKRGIASRPRPPDDGPEPGARVGDAVRPAHADGPVRAGREPAHGRVRHDARAARRRSRSSTRQWAAMNPRARYRDPITVDDVLASPLECAPLHKLDCCLVTDGAGAFVMTSAERARDLAKPPVYVLGAGTCARPHR